MRPAWLVWLVWLFWLFWLVGCHGVLGLSDYEVAPNRGRVGESPSTEAGAEPAFLSGAGCEACIGASCRELSDTCHADATCRELRACRNGCQDPICHQECAERLALGSVWVPALTDLYACVRGSCDDACKPGRHWQCVCNYSAPSGYSGQNIDIVMSIVVNGAARPPIVNLRACALSDIQCAAPVVDQEVSINRVTLSLPSGSQGFSGRFLVGEPETDGGAATQFLTGIFSESLPYSPRVTHYGVLESRSLVEAFLRAGGWTLDRSRGYASVFPFDCSLTPGANLQVEVSGGDSLTKMHYWVAGIPSLTADRTTATPGDGLTISFLPTTAAELIVRDADSGVVVASFTHAAPPDSYLFLSALYPLSRDGECPR